MRGKRRSARQLATRDSPAPASASGHGIAHDNRAMSSPSSPHDAARAPAEHDDGARIAMQWLAERHRKGWLAAFGALMQLWRPGDSPDAWDLGEDGAHMLGINVGEWLLARGRIQARGSLRDINAYVRGPHGPYLTTGQSSWIAQLSQRPLRLYRVTEVRREQGLMLIDELDPDAAPQFVREISASRTAEPGMLLGARLMQVGAGDDAHLELSGAVYPFAKLVQPAVLQRAHAVADGVDLDDPGAEDRRDLLEIAIASVWLGQWLDPPPRPDLRDAATGEPLLLVTDHYRVLDAAALAAALAAQPDVRGDAVAGWSRSSDADDGGMQRSLVAINPGKSPDRIELFCRTRGLADAGREWFTQVAGSAVEFVERETVDPASVVSQRPAAGTTRPSPTMPDLPPEVIAQAVTQALSRAYANWCDEPIPALGGKTPRQAIGSPAGLERVQGLLREYASHEQRSAAEQGRPVFSFQFLWDALGLSR
jgi:hypothetical protein